MPLKQRSFGSLNVVVSRDSADGTNSAPNAPWQARAVTSMAKLTEAPPTAETPAKPINPTRNVTFRPNRSDRGRHGLPAVSSKEELVEALFMERIDSIAALAEAAGEAADPWSGLVSFMEQVAEMLAGDLGLRQMLMFATYGRDTVSYARSQNAPVVGRWSNEPRRPDSSGTT